jgi:hypothetical protein
MKAWEIALVATLLLSNACFAQQSVAAKNDEQLLGQQLADSDDSVRQSAIEALREIAADHPEGLASPLRRTWLKAMAKAGFNDDIVQMTQKAILLSPGSQLALEAMFRARIYALIALGRKDDALADARRYYNVCALDETGRAVDLLVAAMKAKFGDDAEARIDEFRTRQIAAADATEEPPPTQPTTAPSGGTVQADFAAGSNVVDQMILSIPVDDGAYMTEAAKWKANHRQPLGYGNLLLMAGHADEAYTYYTGLLEAARTDKELAAALERQSASMRAQDGNLARAQGRLRRLAGEAH